MMPELIKFLKEKESILRPIYTEKQSKLKRFLNEINNNITLQLELITKENAFRTSLGINPSKFRYDYALQIIDIGHFFSNEFIEKIVLYVDILKELNIRKDMMIDWAICRASYHKSNVKDFYHMLKGNVKEFESIKEIVQEQCKIFA